MIPTPHHPLALAALCSSLLFPTAVRGRTVVMDFDHLTGSTSGTVYATPLDEDGMRLTNNATSPGRAFSVYGPPAGTPVNSDTGHKALSPTYGSTRTYLTAVNGGTFDLVSLQLSPLLDGYPASTTFVATRANGSTFNQTLSAGSAIAGIVGFFNPNFTDLVSVYFDQPGPANFRTQIDNVTINLSPEAVATPDQTVSESMGTVRVGITLAAPAPAAATVSYTISAGTATAGLDYLNPGNSATGQLTIPQGQTTADFPVTIVNDTLQEPLETFTVTFSAFSGIALVAGQNSTTIRIGNDDSVSGFAGWMTGHGLAGNNALPGADPNEDGISNIEAWLFRLNPAGPSPATALDRRPSWFRTAGDYPALRCIIPLPLPTDVTIVFEETTTLATWSLQATRLSFGAGTLWTGTGISRIAETTTNDARTLTLAGSQTIPSRPGVFLRLRLAYYSGIISE